MYIVICYYTSISDVEVKKETTYFLLLSDVRIDILHILKKEELIEMISEQKFRLTGEGLNYCASKIREKCLA